MQKSYLYNNLHIKFIEYLFLIDFFAISFAFNLNSIFLLNWRNIFYFLLQWSKTILIICRFPNHNVLSIHSLWNEKEMNLNKHYPCVFFFNLLGLRLSLIQNLISVSLNFKYFIKTSSISFYSLCYQKRTKMSSLTKLLISLI